MDIVRARDVVLAYQSSLQLAQNVPALKRKKLLKMEWNDGITRVFDTTSLAIFSNIVTVASIKSWHSNEGTVSALLLNFLQLST